MKHQTFFFFFCQYLHFVKLYYTWMKELFLFFQGEIAEIFQKIFQYFFLVYVCVLKMFIVVVCGIWSSFSSSQQHNSSTLKASFVIFISREHCRVYTTTTQFIIIYIHTYLYRDFVSQPQFFFYNFFFSPLDSLTRMNGEVIRKVPPRFKSEKK